VVGGIEPLFDTNLDIKRSHLKQIKVTFVEDFLEMEEDIEIETLTHRDREHIARSIPHSQDRLDLSFLCDLEIKDERFKNGACVLTEHLIILFQRSCFGNSLKFLVSIHLYDILGIAILSGETVSIKSDDTLITLKSKNSVNFVNNLLKNFILSAPMLPSSSRFPFICHDQALFPPFYPNVSFFEAFNLTYLASCSYYGSDPSSSLLAYMKNLIDNRYPFFNVSDVLFLGTEYCNDTNLVYKSTFLSLSQMPFIFGIIAEDINFPDLINLAAPCLNSSCIKVFQMVNCGCICGCSVLASYIKSNSNTDIVYWDLSKNVLSDIDELFFAFRQYRPNTISLRFDYCGLSSYSLVNLFSSLSLNPNFNGLKRLCIAGSYIDDDTLQCFIDYLMLLRKKKIHSLRNLSCGPVLNPQRLIKGLKESKQRIRILHLIDSSISDSCASEICSYIKSISMFYELNLSGCSISIKSITDIIQALSQNNRIKSFSLVLNNLKLSGPKLLDVLSNISQYIPTKLESLSLNDNCFTYQDTELLVSKVLTYTSLKYLSLSGNFSSKVGNIGTILAELSNSNSLVSLNISGKSEICLRDQAVPIICSLYNSHIKYIDISNNNIGKLGIELMSNLVKTSPFIEQVYLDGSSPTRICNYRSFLKSISDNKNIIKCPIPRNDINELLIRRSSEYRENRIEALSALNFGIINNQYSIRIKKDIVYPYILNPDKEISTLLRVIESDIDQIYKKSHTPTVIHNPIDIDELLLKTQNILGLTENEFEQKDTNQQINTTEDTSITNNSQFQMESSTVD